MVTITFPDRPTERKALAFLLGRFSGRVLKTGEHLVPEAALEALAGQDIPFSVKGKATYEQQVAVIRGAGPSAQDEQIASEPMLAPPDLPPDVAPSPMEAHLTRHRRRPLAVTGVVENGLVRPLDPAVKLPEHSRVIIVAAEGN